MATNPVPSAHPYLYVHHANLGIYVSYALRWVGIEAIETQNFLTIFASGGGILVAHRFLLTVTKSGVLAIVFAMFLALDAYYISNWAFNIHRAFTYLSVFGTVHSYWVLKESAYKSKFLLLLFAMAALTLLCADYMFFFFIFAALSVFTLLFQIHRGWQFAAAGQVIICAVFGGVFILRQLQVMAGVGLQVWKRDFLYQILNRLHLEALYKGDWSKTTTDFYSELSILNPGFAPAASWMDRIFHFFVGTGASFLRDILGLPNPPVPASLASGIVMGCLTAALWVSHLMWMRKRAVWCRRSIEIVGLLSTGAILIGLVLVTAFNSSGLGAALAVVLAVAIASYTVRQVVLVTSWSEAPASYVPSILNVGFVCFIACLIMYATFPRYFIQWYPGFLLAPMCTAVWVTGLIAPVIARLEWKPSVGGRFIASLALLKVAAWVFLLADRPLHAGDHTNTLRELKGQAVASNFTPASVASYTHSFSGWLKDSAVATLLLEGTVGPEDYFMIFEAD